MGSLGGVIVFVISLVFFFKALRSRKTWKIILASLFLAFGALLLFGGIYLRYLVETGG